MCSGESTARPMTPLRSALLAALVAGSTVTPASAEKVANKVAVFTGLDKITGRIITFDVYIDETVQFGALRVTPRVCYDRPPTEPAQTDAFVEVDEITLDNQIKRIFTGWMFAASPGLNAVEHPVYDVWLNDCRQESDVPPPGERADGAAREAKPNEANPAAAGAPEAPVGADMVGGVPVPRDKPPIPPGGAIEEDVPPTGDEPANPDAGGNGEILD